MTDEMGEGGETSSPLPVLVSSGTYTYNLGVFAGVAMARWQQGAVYL